MNLNKQILQNGTFLEGYPFVRELAMEAFIIENPNVLAVQSEGLTEAVVLDYEKKLPSGRKHTDGRIDIIAKYEQDTLAIVELKDGEINQQHVDQLKDYLDKCLTIDVKKEGYWTEEDERSILSSPQWIGVLVGTSISPQIMAELKSGNLYHEVKHDGKRLRIPMIGLTLNRYRGADGSLYTITDAYVATRINGRDYTKYTFDGVQYNKRRLVLAVIHHWVNTNPNITFSQLLDYFPDTLQGSKTIADYATAKQKPSRFFLAPHELITLGAPNMQQMQVAVCNQWGENTARFVEYCNDKLKLSIEKS